MRGEIAQRGDEGCDLGELYEADGDQRSAIEIYRKIAELFPDRSDLIDRANDHLARLDAQPSNLPMTADDRPQSEFA